MQKPKTQIIVFGLLALSLILGFISLSTRHTKCQEQYRRDKRLAVGKSIIDVQVATSSEDQAKGLGGRSCLGNNEGMLFIFNEPGFYPFWMKDVKFAIDIAWIDDKGEVVDSRTNVQPDSYPTSYVSQTAAKKVLELAAGELKALNISSGTKIN